MAFLDTDAETDEVLEAMWMVWRKACYEAVEACLPEICSFVDDKDEDIAVRAIELIARFPRAVECTGPVLCGVVQEIAASPARVGAALCTLALLDPVPT
jgi:hypothetical protein